jgi:hypothetical protein
VDERSTRSFGTAPCPAEIRGCGLLRSPEPLRALRPGTNPHIQYSRAAPGEPRPPKARAPACHASCSARRGGGGERTPSSPDREAPSKLTSGRPKACAEMLPGGWTKTSSGWFSKAALNATRPSGRNRAPPMVPKRKVTCSMSGRWDAGPAAPDGSPTNRAATTAVTAAPMNHTARRARTRGCEGLEPRSGMASEDLKRKGQVTCRLKATSRLLLQTVQHNLRHNRRNLCRQRLRLVVEDGVTALDHCCARKGALPGQHLVDHRAQTEDVGPRVQRLPADLLGRHVAHRPQHRASLRRAAGRRHGDIHQLVGPLVTHHLGQLGDAEVEQLGQTAPRTGPASPGSQAHAASLAERAGSGGAQFSRVAARGLGRGTGTPRCARG